MKIYLYYYYLYNSHFIQNSFVYLRPIFCFSVSFRRTLSKFLSCQLLFLSFIGRFPTYLPEIKNKIELYSITADQINLFTVHFSHGFNKITRVFKRYKTITFCFRSTFVSDYFGFLKRRILLKSSC